MNRWKVKIGNRILRRRFRELNRKTVVQNFHTARSAVVLFDTSVPDAFEGVRSFRKTLTDMGISCEVFGIINQKEVPDSMLLRENFSFFTRKDLNWFYKPKGEVAGKYYKMEPDILFDLTMNHSLPVKFLTFLLNAKFKTGCYTEEANDYDLMINEGKQCEIKYLTEQILHYINILQPSS